LAADELVATPSLWANRITKGRKWEWGKSLAAQDLGDYVRLQSTTGPTSGNAMAVFSALLDPQNQANRQHAAQMIKLIAMGEDPSSAYAQVTGGSPASAPASKKLGR
jgi:hypothetical protein